VGALAGVPCIGEAPDGMDVSMDIGGSVALSVISNGGIFPMGSQRCPTSDQAAFQTVDLPWATGTCPLALFPVLLV